jgi:hypothetical protein
MGVNETGWSDGIGKWAILDCKGVPRAMRRFAPGNKKPSIAAGFLCSALCATNGQLCIQQASLYA